MTGETTEAEGGEARWMRLPEGCGWEAMLKPKSLVPDSRRKTLPFHCPLAEREKGGREKRQEEREKGRRKKEREEEREKGKADQLPSVVWLNKCWNTRRQRHKKRTRKLRKGPMGPLAKVQERKSQAANGRMFRAEESM